MQLFMSFDPIVLGWLSTLLLGCQYFDHLCKVSGRSNSFFRIKNQIHQYTHNYLPSYTEYKDSSVDSEVS